MDYIPSFYLVLYKLIVSSLVNYWKSGSLRLSVMQAGRCDSEPRFNTAQLNSCCPESLSSERLFGADMNMCSSHQRRMSLSFGLLLKRCHSLCFEPRLLVELGQFLWRVGVHF